MLQDVITLLGIETSCDETAASVVRLRGDMVSVLSDRVASQTADHAAFGGVVPEIAARAHVERLDGLIREAMLEAGIGFGDLDGVAATAGPGLIGGVTAGLTTGKAIALATGKKFIAVNHLEGHALSPRLERPTPYPYLLLLVSGGHCQFVAVEGLGRCRRLGSTIDDAPGEVFDKTAKLLGLGQPGGPAVEREAARGDPTAFDLPRPLLDRPGLDMSFSGLKTAVRRAAGAGMSDPARADLCASFEAAVADVLTAKARRAMKDFASPEKELRFVVAGGVAANRRLRAALEQGAREEGYMFSAPPVRWCTDNAAMIALAGAERLKAGLTDGLDAPARVRWPLDAAAAASHPVYGAGKKGAKV